MSEPWNLPTLVTTRGVVHINDCISSHPVHLQLPWDPSQPSTAVTRVCPACLPNGLPS